MAVKGAFLKDKQGNVIYPITEDKVIITKDGKSTLNTDLADFQKQITDNISGQVDANPNTIVKRDSAGNILTRTGFGFGTSASFFLNTAQMSLIFEDKVDNKQHIMHTDKNFKIERGTWTPSIGCPTGAFPTMDTAASKGYYERIGNMVYITGRVVCTKGNGSAGLVYLRGLPFLVHNSSVHYHQYLHIGNVQNINYGNHKQLILHLTNGDTTARPRWIDNSTTGWPEVQISDFSANLISFSFSGHYKIQ